MQQVSFVDKCYQLFYILAYRLMKLYWLVRRPSTHGALVALWYEGKILLVRNSYHNYYSLPGGYVRQGENGVDAAIRELKEELGLNVNADQLSCVIDLNHIWEAKRERLEIYTLDCSDPPRVCIDGREVTSAQYYSPEQALQLNMFPPIRQHILEKTGSANSD